MSDTQNAGKQRKPSMTEKRRNARSFALQALYQWSIAATPVNEIEAQFRVANEAEMRNTDTALFSQLLRQVSENSTALEAELAPLLDRALEDLDPVELNVLRIGSYELMYRMEVPYRVAINESVELAKIFGATDSHRYVNGVLDKLAHKVRAAEVAARNKR